VSLLNQDSLFVKPFFLLAIHCAKNQDTFHVLIAHMTPKKSGYILQSKIDYSIHAVD
jgi:hypothetical protein